MRGSRKRGLWIGLLVLVIVAGIGLLVWLRGREAPEAVRLLPEADGYVYVNLKPVRLATAFRPLPSVQRAPEYNDFVQATGIEVERGLDQMALAVHASKTAKEETRYSEVFVGRFNFEKLTNYLKKIAKGGERYNDTDIFVVPMQGRTVRVAILNVDSVAVSNVDSGDVIHGMIDRSLGAGAPFAGPRLVREHYPQLPIGALAWGVARIQRQEKNRVLRVPGGIEIPLPGDIDLLASLRYAGNLQLRIEAFTHSEHDAQQLTENLDTLLALFRAVQSNVQAGGPDPDIKSFIDSLSVAREGDRVMLRASVSIGLMKKIVAEGP